MRDFMYWLQWQVSKSIYEIDQMRETLAGEERQAFKLAMFGRAYSIGADGIRNVAKRSGVKVSKKEAAALVAKLNKALPRTIPQVFLERRTGRWVGVKPNVMNTKAPKGTKGKWKTFEGDR